MSPRSADPRALGRCATAALRLPVAGLLLAAASWQPVAAQPVPVGDEFQVNTYSIEDQVLPAVAMDGMGGFVVVWATYGQYVAYDWSIMAQRYDAEGDPAAGRGWRRAAAVGVHRRV